jgi:uracil DNA glycosylase
LENKDIKKAVMIEVSWYEVLKQEFMAAYFQDLIAFLKKNHQIKNTFFHLKKEKMNTVKVIINVIQTIYMTSG